MVGTELQKRMPLRGKTQIGSKTLHMDMNQTTDIISQMTRNMSKVYNVHVFSVENCVRR